MNTNKLEIFSEEIRRKTARRGGGRNKHWQGKVLVVLIFGVPTSYTMRFEFKRKRDEARLYCFAIGKVEREGEHFRVTLKPKQTWSGKG